ACARSQPEERYALRGVLECRWRLKGAIIGTHPAAAKDWSRSDRVEIVGLCREFAEFDLLDLLDELFVGRGRAADCAALGGDEPVDEVDLGAPALQHVLAHRRPR